MLTSVLPHTKRFQIMILLLDNDKRRNVMISLGYVNILVAPCFKVFPKCGNMWFHCRTEYFLFRTSSRIRPSGLPSLSTNELYLRTRYITGCHCDSVVIKTHQHIIEVMWDGGDCIAEVSCFHSVKRDFEWIQCCAKNISKPFSMPTFGPVLKYEAGYIGILEYCYC